jgi:thiol-disulfide isomerase/thioredoxin
MEKIIKNKIKQVRGMFTKKNMPRLIILLIVLGVLYFVYDKYLKGMEGFEMESKDIDDEVKSGTKLVLFYADWCGHCQKVKPDWEKAAGGVNKPDDKKMIMVNCGEGTDQDQKVMKKYNVDGYPTIIKFVNGTPSLYRGDRDSDSFKDIFA